MTPENASPETLPALVSDVAFTPSVKAAQTAHGSRKLYENMDWADQFSPDIADFIAERTSFYLATSSARGQPYIQHRGGPKGFLHVIDKRTLAFADFAGNRQFITTGNLAENDRAFIFLMDYATRTRVKLWGHAHVSDNKELLAKLMPDGYRARGEQVILFELAAYDVNCQQHIPQKFDAPDVAAALDHLKARIAELEAELAALKTPTTPENT